MHTQKSSPFLPKNLFAAFILTDDSKAHFKMYQVKFLDF